MLKQTYKSERFIKKAFLKKHFLNGGNLISLSEIWKYVKIPDKILNTIITRVWQS
jgi:hypothetical protein